MWRLFLLQFSKDYLTTSYNSVRNTAEVTLAKAELKPISAEERAASPGKFRLVVLINTFFQLGEDFDTFEEAFKFGKDNLDQTHTAAIYDDRGEFIVPKLYRGGFYKVWSEQEIKELAVQSIEDLRGLQKLLIAQGNTVTAGRLGMFIQMAVVELKRIKEGK